MSIPVRADNRLEGRLTTSGRQEPIVVGIDGSQHSADALALGDLLAPFLNRSVLIAFVHSYGEVLTPVGHAADQRTALVQNAYEGLVQDAAEGAFREMREHLPALNEREVHLVGGRSPAAALHDLAEGTDAALVVLATSHRSRLGRILPGGTGERLLSGAPAPVAVAPAGFVEQGPRLRTIGCAFDGSAESRDALEWSAALALAASARLRLIGVHEPLLSAGVSIDGGLPVASLNQVLRREQETELEGAADTHGFGLDVSAELLDGEAPAVLAALSSELDLLVLGSRGYGALRAVLLGSVSRALMRSAESPVVVLPRGGSEAANGRNAPSTVPALRAKMDS